MSNVRGASLRRVKVQVSFTKRQFLKELLDRLDVRWVEERKGIFRSQILYWVDVEKAQDVDNMVRPYCISIM